MRTLDLAIPADAREYCAGFGDRLLGKAMTYVHFSTGRVIFFDSMTDDEAVETASMLWNEIEERTIRALPMQ